MLTLILGPSGSGKSVHLREELRQRARSRQRSILIVPEQFTMQTQKDLCMAHPRGGIMNIDVLSFGRLAHRVFEETGKERQPILDADRS